MVTIIAFITMFIDHLGYIIFPQYEILRIIWRIAFPLFAWSIVRWYRVTKNKKDYIKRLWILAIISQIPFLFMWLEIYNVCFTLLFWLLSLIIIDEKYEKYKNIKYMSNIIFIFIKIILVSTLLYLSSYLKTDYDIFGILTIIILNIFWNKKVSVIYFSALTFLFYCIDYKSFNISFNIEMYAILAIILLYFTPILKYDFKINRTFKYLFYPVHFSLIYIVYLIINSPLFIK